MVERGYLKMPSSLQIQRVQKDAAADVLAICVDAALWLKGKRIVQWDDFLDPGKAKVIVDKRFGEGEVFIGNLNGHAVATITLQWEDGFWGDIGKDPDSGYIHTMAVRRDHSGQGLGQELLDWAGTYFATAGKQRMRLDCVGDNLRLCRYYDDLGFRTIGRKDYKDWHLLMKERVLR
jgi:GNAT superfamily N-acetyltransferase